MDLLLVTPKTKKSWDSKISVSADGGKIEGFISRRFNNA